MRYVGRKSRASSGFDAVRDRHVLEEVFTEKEMALALTFAGCDRDTLAETRQTVKNNEIWLELPSDPAGPGGAPTA